MPCSIPCHGKKAGKYQAVCRSYVKRPRNLIVNETNPESCKSRGCQNRKSPEGKDLRFAALQREHPDLTKLSRGAGEHRVRASVKLVHQLRSRWGFKGWLNGSCPRLIIRCSPKLPTLPTAFLRLDALTYLIQKYIAVVESLNDAPRCV